MAARKILGGGDCVLRCFDRTTGKTRKARLHSKTGICDTCLNNLSQKRKLSASKLALSRKAAETSIARCDEAQAYPKGYAVLGGRHGKR